MRTSYMPLKQADQVLWSQTFVNVVGEDIVSYGVPAPMMTQFTLLNSTLQAAWLAAKEESTRTKGAVAAKDNALKAMKAAAKNIVSIIQGTPGVTDTMKINAGVTVRKTKPTPAPAVTVAPYTTVTAINGRTVTLELRQSKIKRGRPAKVASASVFTAPMGTSIQDVSAWTFYTNTTKTTLDVTFPPSSTGDTVQITAFWSNAVSESGPAAQPVTVNLPASAPLPGTAKLKVAA